MSDISPDLETTARRRVLVTGAAGTIGSFFARQFQEKYELRLLGRPTDRHWEAIQDFGEIVQGDITDLPRMKELCADMDTVLHLAADPHPAATWDSLLPNNIVGAYNIFVAAKSQKCRRVVFASSIHAISGYPTDFQARASDPPNPGDMYGVSKAFGEVLARYMAEQEGLSSIAIRIGAFTPMDETNETERDYYAPMLDAFTSSRDLLQLFERSIDDETIRYALFHGLSANRHNRMDINDARERIGYAPVDDLALLHDGLREIGFAHRVQHGIADDWQKNLSGLRKDL